MYVSIRHYTGVKSPDAAIAKVKSDFLPVISKIDGFEDYYAVKTGPDTITSVSRFGSKPSGDIAYKAAAKWVGDNMAEYLPTEPQVMHGDVVAHTAGKAH